MFFNSTGYEVPNSELMALVGTSPNEQTKISDSLIKVLPKTDTLDEVSRNRFRKELVAMVKTIGAQFLDLLVNELRENPDCVRTTAPVASQIPFTPTRTFAYTPAHTRQRTAFHQQSQHYQTPGAYTPVPYPTATPASHYHQPSGMTAMPSGVAGGSPPVLSSMGGIGSPSTLSSMGGMAALFDLTVGEARHPPRPWA